MRAITHTVYGESDVLSLTDEPAPVLGDTEVGIRVHAAGVDMGVWHLMAGLPTLIRPAIGLPGPKPGKRIRGVDVAGLVTEVGSKVTAFAPGDEVFGTCGSGSFAEFSVTTPQRLARKPAGVSWEAAAASPISGGTALQALRAARVSAGQRVLVLGASGGVGSFAVQLTVGLGATVTGMSSAAKAAFVRGLGATHTLDYATQNVVDAVAIAGGPFDAIIDIAGGRAIAELRRALTPTGALVIVGSETGGRLLGGIERTFAAGVLSLFTRQTLVGLVSSERAADFAELGALIEAGTLTPAIDSVVPLEQAPAAVQALRDGAVWGKIVVSVVE